MAWVGESRGYVGSGRYGRDGGKEEGNLLFFFFGRFMGVGEQ